MDMRRRLRRHNRRQAWMLLEEGQRDMSGKKRRVTYRPSKGQSILGGIMGGVFVLIGVFFVIPMTAAAGGFAMIFGLVWTGFSVAIAGMNLYQAFGKGYVGPEIHIEEEGEGVPSPTQEAGAQDRLTQLRALYDQRLITQEEYEEKRKEILKEL
jgi:hypothetical protein